MTEVKIVGRRRTQLLDDLRNRREGRVRGREKERKGGREREEGRERVCFLTPGKKMIKIRYFIS